MLQRFKGADPMLEYEKRTSAFFRDLIGNVRRNTVYSLMQVRPWSFVLGDDDWTDGSSRMYSHLPSHAPHPSNTQHSTHRRRTRSRNENENENQSQKQTKQTKS